jgi:23S rRNA pseudouridine955/2504/2580 synthase/23S rRNA pseudouridine1911/1915/1917 synthase
MTLLDIIYEDKYLLALNKPAGIMVEDDRYKNPSLISLAEEYLRPMAKKEVFLANVHRLDRPASGVLLFAKKKSALKILNEQFQNRTVSKTYLAITTGEMKEKEGSLKNYLYKDNKNRKALIVNAQHKEAQKVELEYKIKDQKEDKLLWQINLLTGKYHQIRAQLSFIGCPIVGDKKYNSQINYHPDQICLHAWKLQIIHPTEGNTLLFEAPMPKDKPWALF